MKQEEISYRIISTVHYDGPSNAVLTIKDEFTTCSPRQAYEHIQMIKKKLPKVRVDITEIKTAITNHISFNDLEQMLKI